MKRRELSARLDFVHGMGQCIYLSTTASCKHPLTLSFRLRGPIMAKEQRPVSLVVQSAGTCSLIKPGEGFSLCGSEVTNPRGGKLCVNAICSINPPLTAILHGLSKAAALPSDLLFCNESGCGASFKMEEPTPIDQSGMFTNPFMRRRSDRVLLPEGINKKALPFSRRLSLDLKDELHFVGFERKYSDGSPILQQGIIAAQFMMLTHGMASVVVRREGAESMIGSISEGDFFGEYSLLTGLGSDFEVRAVGDCTVLGINQKDFYQLVLKRPALFNLVAKIVSEKFKAAAVTVEHELSRGILGKLSMIPLADLVQTLFQSRRTGTLVIHYRQTQAFIVFLNGAVVSAVSGKKRGEDAFYMVLAWTDGEFCFEPSEPFELQADRDGAVQLDTMGLMMEGMRRLDERSVETRNKLP